MEAPIRLVKDIQDLRNLKHNQGEVKSKVVTIYFVQGISTLKFYECECKHE
jgi:hypothetical protein